MKKTQSRHYHMLNGLIFYYKYKNCTTSYRWQCMWCCQLVKHEHTNDRHHHSMRWQHGMLPRPADTQSNS